MWCHKYIGIIRVAILVKSLRKDPLVDNAAIPTVYRPEWRGDKWTAVQDGRVYQLFPRPLDANMNNPADAIPLTYQDYFSPGNVRTDLQTEPNIDPDTSFNLLLEKVRAEITDALGVTVHCAQYRYASGGSGQVGTPAGQDEPDFGLHIGGDGGQGENGSPVGEEYEAYGGAALSDLSDA